MATVDLVTIDCSKCGQPTPIAGMACVHCGAGSEICRAALEALTSCYRGTRHDTDGDLPYRWVPATTVLAASEPEKGRSPMGALAHFNRFAGLDFSAAAQYSRAERDSLRLFSPAQLAILIDFAVELDCALILGGGQPPAAVKENARLRCFIERFFLIHGADRILAGLTPEELSRLIGGMIKGGIKVSNDPAATWDNLHTGIELLILAQAQQNALRQTEIAFVPYKDANYALLASATGIQPTIYCLACDDLLTPDALLKLLNRFGKRRWFGR